MIAKLFASTAAKLIGFSIIALIILVAVTQCTGQRQKATQASQDARSATATAETAKNAAKTVIERNGADTSVDDLVGETVKEMDNAQDEKASAAAARRAICDLMPDSCQHPAK